MTTKYHKILLATAFVCMTSNGLYAENNSTKETNVIDIVLPTVPKAPEVKAIVPTVNLIVEGESISKTSSVQKEVVNKEGKNSAIVKEKRFPPHYFDKKEVIVESKKAEVGEVDNARVAAYLQAPLMSHEDAVSKLKSAGFTPLASYKIDKKGKVTSIVFVDEKLISAASKPTRGFAATLRLLIDEKSGQISITNPIYIQKAFMQDQYDEALALENLTRLRNAFEGLKNSKDVVKFIRLPRYKFMNSMPVYEDMMVVGTGSNTTLLEKAHASKKVVFEQKLDNGSVLIGVQLSRRTKKFVKKTGYQNSELLPYPVLIEDGKAKILDPKYYIAVMYPLLSMSEFMMIATVPGAIEKDTNKIFR